MPLWLHFSHITKDKQIVSANRNHLNGNIDDGGWFHEVQQVGAQNPIQNTVQRSNVTIRLLE